MITNTQGTGEILGSRMFTIRTVRLKDLGYRDRPTGLTPEGLQELRDNLYIWLPAPKNPRLEEGEGT